MAENTIIQRDIEFYEDMAEAHRTELHRCATCDEPIHRKRMLLAQGAYTALREYQAGLRLEAHRMTLYILATLATWALLAAFCATRGRTA